MGGLIEAEAFRYFLIEAIEGELGIETGKA